MKKMDIETQLIKELAENGTDRARELFLQWQEERIKSKERFIERLDALNSNSDLDNVMSSSPTEEQVLQTIFDCVFIRGIELEDYKRNFTNEQSGLYDALVKLFKGNDR